MSDDERENGWLRRALAWSDHWDRRRNPYLTALWVEDDTEIIEALEGHPLFSKYEVIRIEPREIVAHTQTDGVYHHYILNMDHGSLEVLELALTEEFDNLRSAYSPQIFLYDTKNVLRKDDSTILRTIVDLRKAGFEMALPFCADGFRFVRMLYHEGPQQQSR